MQIEARIPLEITVTSYHPAVAGHYSGPPEDCYPGESAEIEFEIRTLTGHELTDSDFSNTLWQELVDDVLATHEAALKEALGEARISAWEGR